MGLVLSHVDQKKKKKKTQKEFLILQCTNMSEIYVFQQKNLQPDKVHRNEGEIQFKGNFYLFDTKKKYEGIYTPTPLNLDILAEYYKQ